MMEKSADSPGDIASFLNIGAGGLCYFGPIPPVCGALGSNLARMAFGF